MKDTNYKQDRRDFLKKAAFGLGTVLLAPALKIRSVFAATKKVSESDPMAQALGYKADASKVDVKKFPKRAGAEGKKQFCDNCMFYNATDKTQGSCQIFANGIVAAKGWCNTWAKKP